MVRRGKLGARQRLAAHGVQRRLAQLHVEDLQALQAPDRREEIPRGLRPEARQKRVPDSIQGWQTPDIVI